LSATSGERAEGSGPSRDRRLALFCGLAAAVAALDQAVKAAMRALLVVGEPRVLVPGVLDLSLVYNEGAAFSLGEGAGPVFVLVAVVICACGLWLAWRRTDAPMTLVASVACVAGGGVGNAIDRAVAGRVTDFFAATFMDFAVFNVADVFITCGVVASFVLWVRWDSARERAEAAGK
jgi:signal peptidase II